MSNWPDMVTQPRANYIKKRLVRLAIGVVSLFSIVVSVLLMTVPGYSDEVAQSCEKQEHTHTSECYRENPACMLEEREPHKHSDECFLIVKELICHCEDYSPEHGNDCYATSRQLICALEETHGHTHSDDCLATIPELVCGMNEHEHSEECRLGSESVELHNESKESRDESGELRDKPEEIHNKPEGKKVDIIDFIYNHIHGCSVYGSVISEQESGSSWGDGTGSMPIVNGDTWDLSNFVSAIIIKDKAGNIISNGIYSPEQEYTFCMTFSELEGWNGQFSYNADGFLVYQLPGEIVVAGTQSGQIIAFGSDVSIGEFSIDASGRVGIRLNDVNMYGEAAGLNFIDMFSDSIIYLEVSAKFGDVNDGDRVRFGNDTEIVINTISAPLIQTESQPTPNYLANVTGTIDSRLIPNGNGLLEKHEYTIEINVPTGLRGNMLYISDTLWCSSDNAGIANTMAGINTTQVQFSKDWIAGITYQIYPADDSFRLDVIQEPGSVSDSNNELLIVFGTEVAPPSHSNPWQYDDKRVIRITYTLSPVLRGSLLDGTRLTNLITVIGDNQSKNLHYIVDYAPIISKAAAMQADPSSILYTIYLNNRPGRITDFGSNANAIPRTGHKGYSIFEPGLPAIFEDTIDSRLEYIPGTFCVQRIAEDSNGVVNQTRYYGPYDINTGADLAEVYGDTIRVDFKDFLEFTPPLTGKTTAYWGNHADTHFLNNVIIPEKDWFAGKYVFAISFQLRVKDEFTGYTGETASAGWVLKNTASVYSTTGKFIGKWSDSSTLHYTPGMAIVETMERLENDLAADAVIPIENVINSLNYDVSKPFSFSLIQVADGDGSSWTGLDDPISDRITIVGEGIQYFVIGGLNTPVYESPGSVFDYYFRISEDGGGTNDRFWTYDGAVYTVKVEVTYDEDACVTAITCLNDGSWNAFETIRFMNTYHQAMLPEVGGIGRSVFIVIGLTMSALGGLLLIGGGYGFLRRVALTGRKLPADRNLRQRRMVEKRVGHAKGMRGLRPLVPHRVARMFK